MNIHHCAINFDKGGKKVILSIDGGGMKGTIAVAMLAELEKATGQKSYDLFDMVAGTSTGAIIAAGIALGMSAQEILDTIYKQGLPAAFRPSGVWLYLRYLFTDLKYLYSLKPFVEVLGPLADDKTVGDIEKPIILMTTKDLRTSNTYFIVNRGPGRAAFADWPIVAAVAASGAAPIYFPPVAGDLIDGGVGVYQNPSLPASIEAMEYIGASEGFVDGNVIHISLGTGYKSLEKKPRSGWKYWLYDWLQYVISETLDDARLQQSQMTRIIYRDRIDYRRYDVYLDSRSLTHNLGISLDGRPRPEKLGLATDRLDQIELMEEIGRAYACAIDWSIANVMPWDTTGGHPQPGIRRESVDWQGEIFR